ncbi:MAG: aspartyl protease family protein [Chloroflexota bacterium]
MPCLSGKFDVSIGALINIGVSPTGALTPATASSIEIKTFPALIDTGATITCISSLAAQSLGLHPIGKRPMTSATHSVPVNVYLVDLLLPFGKTGFILGNTQVMEFLPSGGSPFQMLVGRDIICRGAFTMSFDGHFTLSL